MIHTGARRILVTAVLAQSIPIYSQTQPPAPDSPIGQWVAEHPSTGGIGSWWEFRPDGTFTLHFGAMVTSTIPRSGDTISLPSGTLGGAPTPVRVKVDATTLHLIPTGTPEMTYTRIGNPPTPSDLLLGRWKPDPLKTPNPDSKIAAFEKLSENAVYVFTADGTEVFRLPFGSREGTWNALAHTFHFTNEPFLYTFQFAGAKLILAQPPDGKRTDTYLRDPIE